MIPALISHLWQSTLFAGTAWLLTLALRKNQAQVRYRIWFIASVKFLVPFSLLVGLGTLVPRREAAPPIQTGWVGAAEQLGQPLFSIPAVAAQVAVTSDGTNRNYFAAAALIFWACGLVTIAICWLVRWRRVRDLRRSATPVIIAGGIQLAVPVMSVPGLVEPGVFGIFRPVLLLPEGIGEQLDRAQLDAILAHELCHVHRRDNLTAAIHMVVQATFWFHPLVWWLGARLVDERERACDEEVLRLGSKPQVYAAGILSICKLYVETPMVCMSGVTGANLKRRIEAIMKNQIALRLNFSRKAALAVVAIAAFSVPIIVGILKAPSVRAQPSVPEQGLSAQATPLLAQSSPPASDAPAVKPPQTAPQQNVAQQSPVQSAPATAPKFDVASIKPCKDGSEGAGRGGSLSPGRLNRECQTVMTFIKMAYVWFANGRVDLMSSVPIEGGPGWIDSDRYTIDAKADGTPDEATMSGPMLQALLEERFKLNMRREVRTVPVYELTVAKGGSRLQPFKEGSCIPVDWTKYPPVFPGPGQDCIGRQTKKGLNRVVEEQGMAFGDFCKIYLVHLDRPVLDKTGITGRFDFRLEYSIDGTASPDEPITSPPLFTAVQEQLGLKLVPTKGPAEYLVIDHVERPSEN